MHWIDKIFSENKNRIIVLKEKHSTRFIDASTETKLAKALVGIIKERLDQDYWYDDTPIPGSEQLNLLEKPKLTEAEKARRIVSLANENLIDAGKNALNFLTRRSKCQYEGIDLEELEEF